MPQQFSFDIVSALNLQEVDNAVNQTVKEVATRFDFKGSKSSVEFKKQEKEPLILVVADDELKLRNLNDILKTRMATRRVSLKALQFGTPEKAFEGTLRQEIKLIQGLTGEKAKEVVRIIKEAGLKVQAAIQGDQVRVTSKSKDELQSVMDLLRKTPFDTPLQFTNYR